MDNELLTEDEHEAVALAGRVACLLDRIVPDGPTRRGDLAELCGHVHVLQNAVLAQAAARAYPGRYRLMGATVVQQATGWPCCDPTLVARGSSPWTCPHGVTWRLGVPGDPYCWAPVSVSGADTHTAAQLEPECRVCDGRGRTHRLGCPEADRTDPLPRDMNFPKPGLTGDSHGDLERLAAYSALGERRCQLATAHDEHGWRPVPGAHTVFRCPGLPGGEASFPAGTEVTVDGSALWAPMVGLDPGEMPAERCRDPWTPDAHPPHRWRPADDPAWRYCDGLQLLHDGLAVRRCRNGSEHGAHRWGLTSDAPPVAWCPGLTLEVKAPPEPPDLVRRLPQPDIFDRDHWQKTCERASAVAVGAGAPDDGATLPEQVEWLAAELHGPSLRPVEVGLPGMGPGDYDLREVARVLRHAAVQAQEQGRTSVAVPAWALGRVADRAHGTTVLAPFVIEAEQGSTGEGVARTLRALRWDCFDRVQLDRFAVEVLLEALADRELAEGDVRYFPAERIHYTVVVDTEGAPHLRPAKIGEIPEVPA